MDSNFNGWLLLILSTTFVVNLVVLLHKFKVQHKENIYIRKLVNLKFEQLTGEIDALYEEIEKMKRGKNNEH